MMVVDCEKMFQVVNYVFKIVMNNNGKLVDKFNFYFVIDCYWNIVKDVGLMGKIFLYSLCYVYFCEVMEYYMQRGFSKKEVEVLVFMDLGYGDGCGYYVV